jgi:hypothetical protein
MREAAKSLDEKKPAYLGGLNPYQRRHGGDKTYYSKAFGAAQHPN